MEAVEIVHAILKDVITSVVHPSIEHPTPEQNNDESKRESSLDEQQEEKDYSEILFEVTETERESDDSARMEILLGLLELACAMV